MLPLTMEALLCPLTARVSASVERLGGPSQLIFEYTRARSAEGRSVLLYLASGECLGSQVGIVMLQEEKCRGVWDDRVRSQAPMYYYRGRRSLSRATVSSNEVLLRKVSCSNIWSRSAKINAFGPFTFFQEQELHGQRYWKGHIASWDIRLDDAMAFMFYTIGGSKQSYTVNLISAKQSRVSLHSSPAGSAQLYHTTMVASRLLTQTNAIAMQEQRST